MQLLTLSVFLSFVYVAFCEIVCQGGTPCVCKLDNGSTIDLSTVGQHGPPRFLFLREGDHLFSYNPCYPFTYSDQGFVVDTHPCSDVTACMITPGNASGSAPLLRGLALQHGGMSATDDRNYEIHYDPVQPTQLKVLLKCDPGVDHSLNITSETEFILTSKCACVDVEECKSASPASSKSRLSTGSVLLITFFVILLVYIGVGILFNFCKGAHGTELLPNVEFWSELPKLIVDGFLFTCSCFGRRSSYSDV